jgi:hypothetical protein
LQFLSIAQCFGYLAFILGVSAFLQKSDRKLRALNGSESLVYAVHFFLLGNPCASASALVSGTRSFLSLKMRSPFLAAAFVIVNVAFGFAFARNAVGWLPVIGSCFATLAIFLMRGVRMRMVLLVSTLCWLANNILSGSIGGTLLEFTIATANIVTVTRMLSARAHLSDPELAHGFQKK